MKNLLIFILLVALGKFAFTHFSKSVKTNQTEENMAKIVGEMNQKMPMKFADGSYVRLDKAAFSDRKLKIYGSFLQGRELTDAMANALRNEARQVYCSIPDMVAADIGVEYHFQKTGLRSINDKVTNQTWVVAIHPSQCK